MKILLKFTQVTGILRQLFFVSLSSSSCWLLLYMYFFNVLMK